MLVGNALGPYVIDKELGSGAMGTVYRGKHKDSGERVAVKLMSPALGASEQARARFVRELDILKQLSHPNIVRYKGSGRYHGSPFFIMEYVQGDSLDHVMARRDRLTWEEIVEMGTQLCGALQHAHDKGIIHRDLKPSNVMVLRDGTVKLTDFGIAKDTDVTALTAANSTVGTAAYMSPEQCKGSRDITYKSDLYSLGVMFYELMTGRKPFQAETAMEMFMKHANAPFAPPSQWVPECPPWLNTLICQLMEKKPDQRPFSADMVAKALAQVKEKMLLQQSAGLDTAKKRRMDRAPTDVALDDQDRDAARAMLGKKKRKKRKTPLYTRGWFTLAALAVLLLVFAGGAYFLFIRAPSADSLYDLAAGMMKADPRRARDEPISEFLYYYPEHPKAKQVQEWADQIDRDTLETQMFNRRNLKLAPESDREELFRLALDSEGLGRLDKAKETWTKLLRGKDDSNPDQHAWELVATKYLNGLQQVEDHSNWLKAALRSEEILGHKKKGSSAEEDMALDAAHEELAGKWSEAVDAWTLLRDQTADKAEQRGWHLLAAKKVRETAGKK